MRPSLVALDLDGTLLTSDKRITARAETAVRALTTRGVRVLLCTGRPPRGTRTYAAQLGLDEALVYNGAARYDFERDEARDVQALPGPRAREVIGQVRTAFPGVLAGLESTDGWFLDEALYALRRPQLRGQPDGVGAIEGFANGGAIKIFFRHPDHSACDLHKALAGLDVYATWSGEALLEVMHPKVSKRNALARMADRLGIAREAVVAFGDGHNDHEMIGWAGLGVAPANGSSAVRAVADEVTTSNDEDGVARVLERWLEAG